MSNDRRRRQLTSDEVKLWRTVMKDATAYPGRLAESEDEAPSPSPSAAPPAPLPGPSFQAPRPDPVDLPGLRPAARTLPHLKHGASPGVDRNTAERLRRGEMVIDAVIDLHGRTQDEAHLALRRFVLTSADQGHRCVLVITGKGSMGTGVLRSQVPRWLNDAGLRGLVLSFSYAQPKHGGEGALYVLLKRRRQ